MTKRMRHTKWTLAAMAGGCLTISPMCYGQAAGENIALGKAVTLDTAPNYNYCSDPDDAKQLTDGIFSSNGPQRDVGGAKFLWVQQPTVGWVNTSPAIVTIDLGSVQPISGVSFSTAAGASSVHWPTGIYLAVSDDKQTWNYAGDLVSLVRRTGSKPGEGYQTYRYTTHNLRTKGRYIRFGIAAVPYTFCDEIEVYKGDDAWLKDPVSGDVVTDMKAFSTSRVITSAAQQRLWTDLELVREALGGSHLKAARKQELGNQLELAANQIAEMPALPADFRTTIPLNDPHRTILAIWGEVLGAKSKPGLAVWKQHRYKWLDLLAVPDKKEPPGLSIGALKNQFRSDALLLTNASGEPKRIALQLQNVPQGIQPGWLEVSSIDWTDTSQSIATADAQLPLKEVNGAFQVEVPAGMTRKIWLTLDSSKLPAGKYEPTLDVIDGGEKTSVPLHLRISPVAMGRPRLSLGMWDYSNGKGAMNMTPQIRDAALESMKSHFIDTPWATGGALPFPSPTAFAADGSLKTPIDFTNLDEWVRRWPEARRYYVFMNVRDSFSGTKMGTPEFHARVGSWARAIRDHVIGLGLQPKQLGILLLDEPHRDNQDLIIIPWAKAINESAPELTLFSTPNTPRPDQNKYQEAITAMDILCVPLGLYRRNGAPVEKYWKQKQAEGKELWFYDSAGPARLIDPQSYYRYYQWHAFKAGAKGLGFWAYSDLGGAPSAWQEYASTRQNFAPAFLDGDKVFNSIHWDAVREGMEDNEELAMLSDKIAATQDSKSKARLQQVLDKAVKAVTAPPPGLLTWKTATDAGLADEQLLQVRAALEGTDPWKN